MTATQQQLGRVRTRWAAIGAAVAVTLGAGGLSLAQAANSDGEDELVLVPLEQPCRLVDTRSAEGFQVGPRGTALGPGEEWVIDANDIDGECKGAIPETAVALNTNTTAKNATGPTFLSFYPASNPDPLLVSNVNPDGTLATPNATTINLDADGMFIAYNAFHHSDVFVDIFGYYLPVGETAAVSEIWEEINNLKQAPPYDDSALWDAIDALEQNKLDQSVFDDFFENEYQDFYTKTKNEFNEIWEFLNNIELGGTGTELIASYYKDGQWDVPADEIHLDWDVNVPTTEADQVAKVDFEVPSDGTLLVLGQAQVYNPNQIDHQEVWCTITYSADQDSYPAVVLQPVPHASAIDVLAQQRALPVTGGEMLDLQYVCGETEQTPGNHIEITRPSLTALFVPND